MSKAQSGDDELVEVAGKEGMYAHPGSSLQIPDNEGDDQEDGDDTPR